jgi:NAD(P)-dependent dehydrogenase (short-subunit alcohol dehydrogenase family)
MHSFGGKVVLVTGGSSGIGRGTALRLAGLGARVAVAARSLVALDEVVSEADNLGASAVALPTDVTNPDQCRAAVEATVTRFGRLDVLVCSAGVSMRANFEGSDLDAMRRVMDVNFFGTLYATYFALPHVKNSRGSLVAISSLTGKRGVPSYALYGASKFAVQGLYESLRLELAGDGVHVGVVSPGFVDTPLRERVLGADGKPWEHAPPPPFHIWPLEKCVNRVVRLIAKRRSEALLPAYVGPLLLLDQSLGGWIGDAILPRRFSIRDHGSGVRGRGPGTKDQG